MKTKLLWGSAGLLVAILLMDNLIMPVFVRKGEEFVLPDVTALTTEEARQTVEDLGLELQIAGAKHSPARLEGTVLSQEPLAGTLVKSGRPVAVIVSKGGQLVRLPYLAGSTVRQASLTLTDLGLVPGEVTWSYADSLPPEVLLSTIPTSGALVPKGSRVGLVVNQGTSLDSLAMPDLVGTRIADAAEILQEMGLEFGVVIRQDVRDLLPGTVLEQSEPAGEWVRLGDVVDFVVAAEEGDA
jgi:beta-lactam-binding protein with PASTA domain